MQVGIDGLALGKERDGSWVYFSNLVRQVPILDKENQYTIFLQKSLRFLALLDDRNPRVRWRFSRRPPLFPRVLYHQWFFTFDRVLQELDLLHTAAFLPPLFSAKPIVLTLHDLNFWMYPETMKRTGRIWWGLFARAGIRKATRIIASSESTKNAVKKYLTISDEKIRVVYPCLRDGFGRVEDPKQTLARYHLPEEYILFVGTIEPRKNLVNLIRAFARAKRYAHIKHALVFAGARGWMSDPVRQVVKDLGIEREVIFLGYVPDEDLASLYSGADLFAYVSWYEGFGLPLLEAMACGVPVITSNVSSMPEVVGDVGVLVDPSNFEEMAFQIIQVLMDRERHDELALRGQSWAQQFSRERFAHQIIDVYREAVLHP